MSNYMSKGEVLFAIQSSDNPLAVIQEIESTLNVGKAMQRIQTEVQETMELNQSLRPLFGERTEVLEERAMLDSEIEMEVMIEYPPNKGSKANRDALRSKLQAENPAYKEVATKLQNIDNEISDIQFRMTMIEQEAKNARRVIEMHTNYVNMVTTLMK